jgi:hypothetical protein
MFIQSGLNSVHGLVGLLDPLMRPTTYLDPGTGSFFIQMLIAVVLGGAFLMRDYIGKGFKALLKLFGRTEPTKDEEDEE